MKSKWKIFYRNVAKILVLTFIITNINISFFVVKADSEEERYILYEIEEKRTENEKYFMNSDGTETIRSYQEEIHYFDGESYQEINECLERVTSISGDNDVYETISNDMNISMPEVIDSENGIVIKPEDNKSIEMIPEGTKLSANEINVNNIVLDEAVNTNEESKSSQNVKSEDLEVNKLTYKYDENLNVSYTTMKNGIKEEFILNSYDGNNIFTTKIKLEGYKLELREEFNRFDIINIDNGEIEGVIPQPVVYDSSEDGNMNFDAIYSFEELGEGEYLINIEVSKDFLTDSETKYPVIIDPTFQRKVDKNNHISSYVLSSKPDWNFWGNNSMPAGYYSANQGRARTYVTLGIPINSGEIVLSAKYFVYSKGGDSSKGEGDFSIYSVNDRWSSTEIRWNNMPTLREKITSKNLKNNNAEWVEFDLSKFASLYSKGQANSFAIVAENETGTYRNFASEYYTNIEPYLELVVGKMTAAPKVSVSAGDKNSSKGSVELSWEKFEGAKGYKLGIFNGSTYDWIDVGNVTTYNTKGKGLWPTTLEIQNGRKTIKTDSKGEDLADDPSLLYRNHGDTKYKNDKNYYVKVKAYNKYNDETSESGVTTFSLPDTTKPRSLPGLPVQINNPDLNLSNQATAVLTLVQRGNIVHSSYINGQGWQEEKRIESDSGEQGKIIEAIKITGENLLQGIGIRYKVNVQGYGWDSDWKSNGEIAGYPGSGKSIEAIKIELTGDRYGYTLSCGGTSQGGSSYYVQEGEILGVVGQSKRLETFRISLSRDVYRYKIERRKASLKTGEWEPYIVEKEDAYTSIYPNRYTVKNLEDGYKHQFRITSYDVHGNYSDPVVSSEVIDVDRTKPVVGTLEYDQEYISSDFLEVQFNDLYDDSEIKSIEFRIKGKSYKSYPIDSKNVKIDLSGLPSEDICIQYKFTDVYKNYARSEFTIKRDIDAPETDLTPIGLESGNYFTGIMAIDTKVNDLRSGVKSWTLYCSENNINNTFKTVIDTGFSSVDKTIAFDTSHLINNKIYKIFLESYDNAGNQDIKEFVFIKKSNVNNNNKEFDVKFP